MYTYVSGECFYNLSSGDTVDQMMKKQVSTLRIVDVSTFRNENRKTK